MKLGIASEIEGVFQASRGKHNFKKRITQIRATANFFLPFLYFILPSGMMLPLQRADRPAEHRVFDPWWGTARTTGSSTMPWRAPYPVSLNLPPLWQWAITKHPLKGPEVLPSDMTLNTGMLCNCEPKNKRSYVRDLKCNPMFGWRTMEVCDCRHMFQCWCNKQDLITQVITNKFI